MSAVAPLSRSHALGRVCIHALTTSRVTDLGDDGSSMSMSLRVVMAEQDDEAAFRFAKTTRRSMSDPPAQCSTITLFAGNLLCKIQACCSLLECGDQFWAKQIDGSAICLCGGSLSSAHIQRSDNPVHVRPRSTSIRDTSCLSAYRRHFAILLTSRYQGIYTALHSFLPEILPNYLSTFPAPQLQPSSRLCHQATLPKL